MPTLLMIGDAAEAMGIRTWKLGRLREKGHVPEAVKVGRYYLVPQDKLDAIKARLKSAGLLKASDFRQTEVLAHA